MGHTFIAIPDGSYLYSEDGKEELMGEYFVISDGHINQRTVPRFSQGRFMTRPASFFLKASSCSTTIMVGWQFSMSFSICILENTSM